MINAFHSHVNKLAFHEHFFLLTFTYILTPNVYTDWRLPFFNSKVFLRLFPNSVRATDLNHCHSLLLGIQSVILLSLWHRNVCKLISALSLVNRRVNHVRYSNIYGALIGSWKNHAGFA